VWGQVAQLQGADTQSFDYFGTTVALGAGMLVVGASSENGGPGNPLNDSGAAYVFEPALESPGDWIQAAKLSASDAQEYDYFGQSAAVDGKTIVVSAPGEDGVPEEWTVNVGAVYAFLQLEVNATLYLPSASHCLYLYFDDFSDPDSGWPVADTANTQFAYLNGEYRILVKNPTGIGGAVPGVAFENYLVTTEVRNPFNRAGSYGLLFGQVSGFTGFYTFEIDNAQNYAIWRWNGAWALLAQGTSPVLKPGAAANTLAIERNGAGISAFANGTLVTSVTDGQFTGELRVGVWAAGGGEANLDVRFDDYRVEPLGCGLSAGAFPEGAPESGPQAEMPPGPAWIELGLPPRGE
jgi:hypothetical protein